MEPSKTEPQPDYIELPEVPGLGRGYDRLAEHMSAHPQLGIFRRFGSLFTELILYYQAEITALERRLEDVRADDRESPDAYRQQYALSWVTLFKSRFTEEGSPEREHYEIVMRLREIMPQYYHALYLQKKALSLRKPHKKLLKDLREWMERDTLGNITILSPDWQTWDDKCAEMEKDLLTFENSTTDGFTSFLTYTIVDRKGSGDNNSNSNVLPLNSADVIPADAPIVAYSHRRIESFTRSLTVLIACMLPIAAMMLLNSVEDMKKRLNIIAGLTGLFSVTMNIFTMATLPEIFAATAA
ncbi:hypothetical protein OQA88_4415 [Cercophora sp. LCS_1]